MWKGMEDLTVSSASLKTLTIKLGYFVSTLSIDTPNLLHFNYFGCVASDYPLVTMGNLVDAQINLLTKAQLAYQRKYYNGWFDVQVAIGYSNVWKLFHGIRNVPHLDLFPDTFEVISMCSESLPVFNNLKSLAIWSGEDRGWQAMPALLRNCPNLETLVIKILKTMYVTDKCGDVCDSIYREHKGLSLTLCPVKVMKIHGFQGTMKEMAMIEHFWSIFHR
ncbi:unnamed protein product [Brassica oleracea var. botrytis]|uniref:FBD domain-containing protein n=2 Tax=Brassica TaxID=3705 RepID=A0A3P6H8H6_BRAOL|nr:unnamed protein product [Brassica napus]VDD62289.1 unnamed protein product [Brassica oleracea]